jgi:hypothetical protein
MNRIWWFLRWVTSIKMALYYSRVLCVIVWTELLSLLLTKSRFNIHDELFPTDSINTALFLFLACHCFYIYPQRVSRTAIQRREPSPNLSSIRI